MVNVVGIDKTVIKTVTCRSCASILEYTNSEVQTVTGTDYGGGPDGKEFIICPVCPPGLKKVVIRSW